jgi:hypothetical protein
MAEFNLHQKRQLFEQGWVIIPQVVPADMVRAARHIINSTIENYLDSIQVRAHELKTDERLTNILMKTDAFSLIESVLGKGKVVPSTNVQCALRFPEHGGTDLKVKPHIDSFQPSVDLPEPVQIKAKAGDMIFAHYQLAHTAAANLSQAIRYAVYIRMHHVDRPKDSLDVLTDIWKYWYGMSEVIN